MQEGILIEDFNFERFIYLFIYYYLRKQIHRGHLHRLPDMLMTLWLNFSFAFVAYSFCAWREVPPIYSPLKIVLFTPIGSGGLSCL